MQLITSIRWCNLEIAQTNHGSRVCAGQSLDCANPCFAHNIYIGPSGNVICPVAATVAFTAVRGTSAGPFFRSKSGRPLQKSHFIAEVRRALAALSLSSGDYARVTVLGLARRQPLQLLESRTLQSKRSGVGVAQPS